MRRGKLIIIIYTPCSLRYEVKVQDEDPRWEDHRGSMISSRPHLAPQQAHTHTHSTAAVATPAATQLGHDKTGHDPTRRDTIRHKTKTSNRRYRSTHSGLTCTAKGPRPAACATLWAHVCVEDMLTPGGVRPLWAAGCGLCGLEAWPPGIQSPSPAGSAQLLPRSRNEAQQKSPYQGDPQLAS